MNNINIKCLQVSNRANQIFEWMLIAIPKRGAFFGYIIALMLMLIALLIRLYAAPLEAGLQYLTFFPAVTLTIITCGVRPGLFALIIGIFLATFIFTPPYYTLSLSSLQVAFWANIIFLIDGIIISFVVAAMNSYISKLKAVIIRIKWADEIIHATQDGFLRCDINGKILDVNNSYCQMIGYTREELLDMSILDLDANDNPAEITIHMQRIIDQARNIFETRHLCKNGEFINLEITAGHTKSDLDSFFVFVRDISERKSIEREIAQSRMEVEDLFNHAPCGYHSLDLQGRFVRVNQTESTWLGYDCTELIGRKIQDFQTPESVAAFERNFPEFLKNGYINDVEYEFIRKNGSILPVMLSATTLKDSDGNFVMSRSIMSDMTERKKNEAALIGSEQRFRTLFEKAPISIIMALQDQKIISINEASCKMFGYTKEEFEQLYVSDLIHSDFIAETKRDVASVLDGETTCYSAEKKYVDKHGGVFWGRVIATEINSIQPQQNCIMGMISDISEQVENEAVRIAEASEQRDVLIREVHHRIKNHLQGVVCMLRQHAKDHHELADVIDSVVGKIFSIATIHGLQANSLSEEIDLDALVDNIINASRYELNYENLLTSPVFLHRNESVPIALVLNELITNACKHGAENTLASMRIQSSGEKTILTLSNFFEIEQKAELKNGQGLNLVRSLLPRIFTELSIKYIGNVFTAELTLSPPVTINQIRNITH